MIEGHCLCGTVRFAVDAVRDLSHCHCSMCRKHHGAAFATMARVREEAFRWTAGEDRVRRYESSPGFHRSFCGACGSSLPGRSPAGGWFVPAGLFADDPGKRPNAHIFTASAPALGQDRRRPHPLRRLAAEQGSAGNPARPAGGRGGAGRELPLRRDRLGGAGALRARPQLPLLTLPEGARGGPCHQRLHGGRRPALCPGRGTRGGMETAGSPVFRGLLLPKLRLGRSPALPGARPRRHADGGAGRRSRAGCGPPYLHRLHGPLAPDYRRSAAIRRGGARPDPAVPTFATEVKHPISDSLSSLKPKAPLPWTCPLCRRRQRSG